MWVYSHGHVMQQSFDSVARWTLASPGIIILKVGGQVLSSTDVLEMP